MDMFDVCDLFPSAQTQEITKEQEQVSSREEPKEVDFLDSILEETTARLSEKKQSDTDEVSQLRERIAELEKKLEQVEKEKTVDPNWRNLQVTEKQRAYLVHLRDKFRDNGLSFKGTNTPKLRGDAYELIKNMVNQLKQIARKPNVKGCDIGPFSKGFCTFCGLPEKRR